MSEQDRTAYATFFAVWITHHAQNDLIRRFPDHDGGSDQICWKAAADDIIGVKLEILGEDISFSATRAWVLDCHKKQFS